MEAMELKKGYKQTEVGVIPDNWNIFKIKDACKLINGRGFKPFEWKTEGLPIIRIQNLNGSEEYNYFQGVYDKKLEVENRQLLFAWSGSRGTSFGPYIWKGEKGLLNYHTWKVVVNEKIIESNYFLHSLKQLTKFIESKAHGASALVHTQKWEMEGFEFPCPPTFKEQTAIATALSDTDALISGLEKLIAKKRNIKQGAMQRLLTPKESWKEMKLGEICDVRDGTHQTPSYVSSGIPFYSVENVTQNDFKNTKFITEVEHKFLTKNWKIEKGDVLMTRIGSIGDCKYVNWTVNASFYVSLALLKMKSGFSGKFLSHYSKSDLFKKEIEINSLMSAIPKKINLGQISNVTLIMPNQKEQTRIAKILTDMDTEITALEIKFEKYKMIKQGMMQNLLTGKVRLL
ncbi:Restriction endonuclease type I, HsdS-like [Desulfonema limicola]|uniref:Restriction endonuclease type I, HsdS-like n=1 Tax=Desulfonema limicola TaxID=45656 RepID=A0A975BC87_9BACT|nr:restriction endonuclease subunit S [Desulfonema limicola]QTA82711.1 Restriction endonuclease type I, HsdS-like [Desulfonema limicola]